MTAKQSNPAKKPSEEKGIAITKAMTDAIERAKKTVKDGESKANAARDAYGMLGKHTRKQIIHVFMAGCGLTKAGAATYYQNVKLSASKPQAQTKDAV